MCRYRFFEKYRKTEVTTLYDINSPIVISNHYIFAICE